MKKNPDYLYQYIYVFIVITGIIFWSTPKK
jgi:hypothetical protein